MEKIRPDWYFADHTSCHVRSTSRVIGTGHGFSEDFVQAGFAATTAGAHYFGNYGVPGVGTILKANIQMLINGEVTMGEYIENVTAEIQAAIDETYG